MDNGTIMLPNNDDTRPRRKYGKIKVKVKQPWELSTGHKEHRDTLMDNRPKRLRTRRDIDRSWRRDYDM
jgi:hypothetical protein